MDFQAYTEALPAYVITVVSTILIKLAEVFHGSFLCFLSSESNKGSHRLRKVISIIPDALVDLGVRVSDRGKRRIFGDQIASTKQ